MCKCDRRVVLRLLILAGALPVMAVVHQSAADEVWLPGIAAGGVSIPAQSMRTRRFARTIHQQYDYSCGSAAVATLLTFQYGTPIDEQAVFSAMWKAGDKAKIRHEGFSLLDMKNYLDSHGFVANGYVAPLTKLVKVGIPAIVLVSERGYNHFVVVKGLEDQRVLLGDPSTGTRVLPLERFRQMMRSPILFVITNHRRQAVFNGHRDWSQQPLAPLGAALTAPTLGLTRVLSPGAIQF